MIMEDYVTCALLSAFGCATNKEVWNKDMVFEKLTEEQLFF